MQAKKTQLIRLANVFGMDVDKEQHQVALFDVVDGIIAADDFIEYCRDHKNSVDYSNRVEKLEEMFRRFKKIEEDRLLETQFDAGERFARTLSGKIASARDSVEEAGVEWNQLRDPETKEPFFKDSELRMLKMVGSVSAVIEYSRINRLSGEIYKLYAENVRIKYNSKNQIAANKDVMKLVRKVL